MERQKILELSNYFLLKSQSDILRSEIKDFQHIMKVHNSLYYEQEEPIISDFEYDTLFKKLKALEEKFWMFDLSESVWSDLKESSFEKVKHSRPMISLDNTYNEEDLRNFDSRVKKLLAWESGGGQNTLFEDNSPQTEYSLEFKFDGLWIELIYKWWDFIQAITRWNGVEWEDVTENIKTIQNIKGLRRFLSSQTTLKYIMIQSW